VKRPTNYLVEPFKSHQASMHVPQPAAHMGWLDCVEFAPAA
jgi:hypothetical protein